MAFVFIGEAMLSSQNEHPALPSFQRRGNAFFSAWTPCTLKFSAERQCFLLSMNTLHSQVFSGEAMLSSQHEHPALSSFQRRGNAFFSARTPCTLKFSVERQCFLLSTNTLHSNIVLIVMHAALYARYVVCFTKVSLRQKQTYVMGSNEIFFFFFNELIVTWPQKMYSLFVWFRTAVPFLSVCVISDLPPLSSESIILTDLWLRQTRKASVQILNESYMTWNWYSGG